MASERTCKNCANNEHKARGGCAALTKRIKTNCWAWMDKHMKAKVNEDIKKYSK